MKKVLVLGGNGFLGQQLEYRLKKDGCFVVSAGRSRPKYRKSIADEFHHVDLRNEKLTHVLMARHEYDEVFQMAGEVGGLGYIATKQNDADIMTNSVKINIAVLEAARSTNPGKILFASSQCVYPDRFEIDPFANERLVSELDLMPRGCRESDASFGTFPFAQEKLFSERLYATYAQSYGLQVRLARPGNTFGPYCEYQEPRSKAVAAICRKVAQAKYSGVIRLWGDGTQTRSFTYVDDAIEGMIRLMASDYQKPVNIAHAKPVSIVELFETICKVAGKVMAWEPEPGPVGNASRTSDNTLCRQVLNWEPDTSLYDGLLKTYPWIAKQVLTTSSKLTTL